MKSSNNNLPKILIIGGPDVHSRIMLINKLKTDFNFVCAGSDVDIKDNFSKNNINFIYYPLNLGFNLIEDLYTLISLIKLILKCSPDIVHTFDTKPNIYGRLAAWLCRVKIIIGTQPGVGMVFSKYNPRFGKVVTYIFSILLKFICKISDLTIYQNKSDWQLRLAKKIVNHANSSIIISSGVDTKFYNYPNVSRLKPSFSKKEKINIIFIGRLLVSKGIIYFCNLAKNIRLKYPNIFFTVVGEIPISSPDKVDDNILKNYSNYVRHINKVPNVKKVLTQSDLIVFPSFYTEGVPRVLLEASSMSLPIVAFDNPGSDEAVINKFNGYLVPKGDLRSLEDSVLKILRNKTKYNRFSKNSRLLAIKNFDISDVAKQYKIVYEKFNLNYNKRK